jgi:2'-5' RNA ligase
MEKIRYNAALLALDSQRYVGEAQRFAKQAQGYLLGDHSLPHVTLAQFYANQQAYAAIVHDLQKVTNIPHLEFTGFNFGKDDREEGTWWVSLSIARNPTLMDLHQSVCTILKKHQIQPINRIGDLYRPHLTLARIQKVHLEDLSSAALDPSPFAFVIGEADEFGQFKKVLCKLN